MPLKYRITAALFSLAAIILAVVLSQVLSQYFEGSRDQIVQQEQATLALLGEFARIALLTADYDIFQPQLERVSNLPGVSAVLLADNRGVIVVASKPAWVGQPMSLRGVGEEGEWQAMPLENVAGRLGTLAARFSNEALMALHRQVRRLAFGWSLGGLFLIALASVLISHLLTRRLERVTRAAAAVAGGDLSAQAALDGRDEVAELGRVFDGMVHTIKEERARLKEREQHLSLMLDSIGDAVIATDVVGCVTRMNPVAETLTGWCATEAAGRPLPEVFRIINAQTRKPVADPVEKVLRTGKVVNLANQTALISKDGAEYHIDDSGAPITDNEGNLLGVVLVFHDISGRKQAEEAFQTLIKSTVGSTGQEFFDKTVANLEEWLGADCVIIGEIVDKEKKNVRALAMILDGEIIHQYSYMLPGTPCESVAMKGFCFYPEGIIKLFPDDKDLVQLGAEGYAGAPLRDKNGNSIGMVCVKSRRKLSLPPMAKDVFEIIAAKTSVEIERRRAEEELAMARTEWEHAMDFFEDAIYLIDMEDRVVRANRAFYKLTGLTLAQTVGQDITSLIHPQGETVPCPVCIALRDRRDANITMEADHPDNPIGRPIEVMVKMIRNKAGLPIGVLMGIHDLFRQRQIEDELRKHRDHLEKLVDERTRELEGKNRDLERYNRLFVDREFRIKELREKLNEL